MCNNSCGGYGGNSCTWIIILLTIWVVCGGGLSGGNNCGCNNNCDGGNNCGC